MSRRARIALVIIRLGRGGAEHLLVSLANRLDPARFCVDVITIRDAGELAGELAPHVALHALNRRRSLDVASLRRFARLLERRQVDLVHTHSHLSAHFVRLARPLGSRRPEHVVHEHYPLARQTWMRFVDRLLLRRVDHVFAASSELRSYAVDWIGLPPERCEVLANGIELDRSPPRAKPPTFTIVQVGRVAEQKDQRLALEVAARLRADGLAFRWLFVGRADSAYAGRCRLDAARLGLEDAVRFLGEQANPRALVRGAHVGVLTSHAEGLPLALLEYMAEELPVVVTAVGDAGALVRASGGGRVVPHGDVPGLAAALRAYARDSEAAAHAGEAGRRYVERHHTVDAMVRRVEAVYDRLVRRA